MPQGPDPCRTVRLNRTTLRCHDLTLARTPDPPSVDHPERVRRTPLGPWVNGPRVCGAHRHGTRRQWRVQRRRAVKTLHNTGVMSRVPRDSSAPRRRGWTETLT